ncbi:CLUMA_CG011308, isoform A [Clunio marinus]|uniref:CLUMA_CG011308, isoform A n=1 Tax=Clunio marinus TaxID=568069 RepID=A0A1J1ICB9_9DIPT|nr:CLUMA_CG011308, isoform A [Clunio marinus]
MIVVEEATTLNKSPVSSEDTIIEGKRNSNEEPFFFSQEFLKYPFHALFADVDRVSQLSAETCYFFTFNALEEFTERHVLGSDTLKLTRPLFIKISFHRDDLNRAPQVQTHVAPALYTLLFV